LGKKEEYCLIELLTGRGKQSRGTFREALRKRKAKSDDGGRIALETQKRIRVLKRPQRQGKHFLDRLSKQKGIHGKSRKKKNRGMEKEIDRGGGFQGRQIGKVRNTLCLFAVKEGKTVKEKRGGGENAVRGKQNSLIFRVVVNLKRYS